MNEFAQKFADFTTKMRKADLTKDAAHKLWHETREERDELIKNVREFVSGVYDVPGGHVVVTDEGNISFYAKDDCSE